MLTVRALIFQTKKKAPKPKPQSAVQARWKRSRKQPDAEPPFQALKLESSPCIVFRHENPPCAWGGPKHILFIHTVFLPPAPGQTHACPATHDYHCRRTGRASRHAGRVARERAGNFAFYDLHHRSSLP